MDRRIFLGAAAGLAALPFAARAQGFNLAPIEPQNPLEQAFVGALTHADMRPAFRHALVTSPLALALASDAADAALLFVDVVPRTPGGPPFHAAAVFTSLERLFSALGGSTPHVVQNGRAVLERLRGQNVVLNYHLLPMLTLEPSDVAGYLAQPAN